MGHAHAYPDDLARYVEAHWPLPGLSARLPSRLLAEALSAAFQASLMLEEARPSRFRLLLTPFSGLPEAGAPNEGVLRLKFLRSRALHEVELRRLAPAAPFETSLIAAHVEQDKLRIWGLAHSGPAWLAPTWGGRNVVPNWSYDPIIHVTGPGQLAVRCAGKLVGAIEHGALVDATIDVFESEWLPAMFAREREEVRAQHDALQAQQSSPTSVDLALIGRVGQHMLRRVIQLVRGARHGGMILVTDHPPDSGAALAGLRLKYRFEQDEPAQRYRSLLLEILDQVAAGTASASAGWSDFASNASPRLEKLEQAIFEFARVVANLAAIDGAVVLDKRFRLVGFGAEVSAELPTPEPVSRALESEGHLSETYDIENVGTRHRAAYRFAAEHPNGVAIVISQDGGVSVVANRAGRVTFWEQSVGP